MDNDQQFQNLDCWAIVDLFGHQKIAGKLTTQTLGAAALIRVDVPEIEIPERDELHWRGGRREPVKMPAYKKGGYTRFFGVGAIYSINPVSEELARRAMAVIDAEPVKPYEIPQPLALPAAVTESDHGEDPEGL
jgi:hypothetical protein